MEKKAYIKKKKYWKIYQQIAISVVSLLFHNEIENIKLKIEKLFIQRKKKYP